MKSRTNLMSTDLVDGISSRVPSMSSITIILSCVIDIVTPHARNLILKNDWKNRVCTEMS
ncbi:unnamed protein product, partial [Amoebophrya sp. A25]|eukprot:GSA25T00016172001.1